jgi:urocanate hydratase
MTERAEDLQTEALRAFTLLGTLKPDWRGALIVACGLGPGGSALSIAGNIAGAGCLGIDERPDVGRAALRSGACDFVVNTVDEALRVLKNEIRQRRPVSVGLTRGSTEALEELVGRGVLPKLFTVFRRDADALVPATATWDRVMGTFGPLGTVIVDFDGSFPPLAGVLDAADRLDSFTTERGYHLESFAFGSAEELRAFDARLLQIVPATDMRHRWCASAPRFFHRERPYRRVVFLTKEERERATGDLS